MKRARIACPVLARTALSHLRSLFGKVIVVLPRLQQRWRTLNEPPRERVTAVADDLSQELSVLKTKLAEAKERVAALMEENSRLQPVNDPVLGRVAGLESHAIQPFRCQ